MREQRFLFTSAESIEDKDRDRGNPEFQVDEELSSTNTNYGEFTREL